MTGTEAAIIALVGLVILGPKGMAQFARMIVRLRARWLGMRRLLDQQVATLMEDESS